MTQLLSTVAPYAAAALTMIGLALVYIGADALAHQSYSQGAVSRYHNHGVSSEGWRNGAIVAAGVVMALAGLALARWA